MSTRNATLAGAIALWLTTGCSPTLEEGRFSCGPGVDCPAGFACRASDMLCYRPSDAGATLDAPMGPDTSVDAPSSDAGRDASGDAGGDAGGGCGPNCIQLMVLNADPDAVGSIEFPDDNSVTQHVPIPPYGTTSATIDVPNVTVPGMLHVNVPPTATLFHDLPIPAEGRYLLVLGPASVGASVLLLQAPRTGLHTDGYVYIQLVDMTADETLGFIASGAGRNMMDRMNPNGFAHDTISPPLPFLPGSTGALRLEYDPTTPQLIAALLADQIPATEGTYYVVLSGRVNQHLDMDDGLRFIPGIPSATALRSSRLVRVLDTLSMGATVCDGTTPLATLLAGGLSAPLIPRTSAAWTLTVHISGECATGMTHDVSVGTAVGRTLVSIAGDVATSTTWAPVSISEPHPQVGGNSTIVIHNGLQITTDIAGATGIPSLGTSSVMVVSAPATIMANTMFGIKTFDWTPATRQSWVVLTFASGATYKAYEVDSPFRTPWTLTVATSH